MNLPACFPDVRFVFNAGNVGFARACNEAIRLAAGTYLLLLNPDVLIEGRHLEMMVQFMDSHPRAGASGPRLLYPDGRLQFSCRCFPTQLALLLRTTRLEWLYPRPVRKYLMSEWDHSNQRVVDWILGTVACGITC